MNTNFFTPRASRLNRRSFLRGTGVALSLPFLDAMVPAFAPAAEKAAAAEIPRRMLAIQTNMGIMPEFFFPEKTGKEFQLPPYLEILKNFRNDFTVFSGVSHPNVDGGHQAEKSFFTAAAHPGGSGFRNTVSVDQVAAEHIGWQSRFPSFSLVVGQAGPATTLSWTRGGVPIPAERSPAALYQKMFVQGTPAETESRIEDLKVGRSVLDFVNDEARKLNSSLGSRDRARLDQYFTSIRDLEKQMVSAEQWERRPRPTTTVPAPRDITDNSLVIESTRLNYQMARLALETDSTRLVTVFIHPLGIQRISGVTRETHVLTHQTGLAEAVIQLRKVEEAQFKELNTLLTELRGVADGGETLLDRTMVLYGTCMGNAAAHSNVNLPVLLAGGGFKHAGHLAFDTRNNYPLPNLFVSMLQRLGIETDKFASSTGTMQGLELA